MVGWNEHEFLYVNPIHLVDKWSLMSPVSLGSCGTR